MHKRIYTLYLSLYSKLVIILGAVFSTLLPILFLSTLISSTGPDAPPRWFGLVFVPIAAFGWYPILYFPRRIVVADDTRIEFISPLRRRQIDVVDIQSIVSHPFALGILVVRYRGGKVWLVHQFDGFHEFLTVVKSKNPSIRMRGV